MGTATSKGVRLIAALALTLGIGGFGVAAPAIAAPTIDPTAKGTLHLFKGATPAAGTSSDGLKLATDPDGPIPGVEFTITPITDTDADPANGTLDLTTPGGWTLLAQFQDLGGTAASLLASGTPGPAVVAGPTGDDGWAVKDDLAPGVYVVTETRTPAGVVPSVPFLVTLPMTDPAGTGTWLTDVYAYPKNDSVEATKTVNKETANIGEDLTYTITGKVPQNVGLDGERVAPTAFAFVDDYDEVRLNPEATEGIKVVSDGTALTSDDYTVTDRDGVLVVELDDAGLAKLVDATQVTVTFKARVLASGDIVNAAQFVPSAQVKSGMGELADPTDDDDDAVNLPVPTNAVETVVGGAHLTKVDAASASTLLGGASFRVYQASDAGLTTPVAIDATDDGLLNPVSTWTTNADGVVSIDGLAVGAYLLVEVKAPVGYELSPTPSRSPSRTTRAPPT
ncbi:isopeptide-forming domain-containing fimbrial protein [Xylanimonas allomyrinae]|uniref:Isopeptide-forming domain-containing fimbrial protein n=1 Tax=Xylanimonas allomyrinae TaxID=2509459 RepID=A0A4P6ELW6_9MICO|nr:SpaH/EbpB family LPXTG-anchored major pilin [Xylanimonas allomyrinae]QAY63810.1 isopeptide-forming domain-containing fimbrial protein [Xylanimonas allomyrinae]